MAKVTIAMIKKVLAQYDMRLVKDKNTHRNVGRTPELLLETGLNWQLENPDGGLPRTPGT